MKLPLSRISFPIVAIALALFALLPMASPGAQQTLGIAAVVNEEVVSLYDLESRINLLVATSNQVNTAENRRRQAGQILNQLINEKLQLQEATRLGIKISEKEIERAYNDVARGNKMTKEQLTDFLNKAHVEKEVLANQLHTQIAWGRAVNRLFRSEISIGSDEVDEIIAEIQDSEGKPEYLVAEIFIPIDRPENTDNLRKTADNIISQLHDGAKFEVLARNFSQSATAAVGGDLGWVRQGQLTAELDTAIVAMADGTLSEPIHSLSGFHILLKRQSRISQGLKSKDEQVDLFQVFLPIAPSPSDATVKAGIDAAAQMTAGANSCSAMEKIAKQTGSALSGRLGKVKISSLPPQTRELVSNIENEKPSTPIRSGDGIVVLMVCDREGQKSVNEIRDNIETRLLNERLDIMARRHLRDLRRTAFLDIRI